MPKLLSVESAREIYFSFAYVVDLISTTYVVALEFRIPDRGTADCYCTTEWKRVHAHLAESFRNLSRPSMVTRLRIECTSPPLSSQRTWKTSQS